MDRPTCKTCKYWDSNIFDGGDGYCESVSRKKQDGSAWLVNCGCDCEMITNKDFMCSEHQLFPKWIELQEVDERR